MKLIMKINKMLLIKDKIMKINKIKLKSNLNKNNKQIKINKMNQKI